MKPTDEELKKNLDPLQYRVTQEDATERAFANAYWDNKRPGYAGRLNIATPCVIHYLGLSLGTSSQKTILRLSVNSGEYKRPTKGGANS